jgi:UDP-N-acetylmuramoyl-tripeptide--D-alanyl-D-alanine ligase
MDNQMTIDEIKKATGGEIICRGKIDAATGVCIDSRIVSENKLFFAIKGPHFDGHDFVTDAKKKGASTIIIEKKVENLDGVNVVLVKDTVKALGDLASWWRMKFKVPCIAITGSNGKTTTKEMIASIVGQSSQVLKTEGNFNNLIGLPLTLFRWEEKHQVAVIEMGMNALGEIKRLTQICKPNVGIITNVTAAHLEKLGTIEKVAEAKGELFQNMSSNGVIAVNNEDPLVSELSKQYKGKKITFGMKNDSDIRFGYMESQGLDGSSLILFINGEEKRVILPVPGIHNVMNAMAATAVACALGIGSDDIIKGLQEFKPLAMRMERMQLANGVQLINDCYNANPTSMREAFRTVSGFKRAGRFIAMLGDMFELGESATELHLQVGKNAAEYGVDKLLESAPHIRPKGQS